jgi:hypothetical protein
MASLYSRVNSLAVPAKSSVNTPGTAHFCEIFTYRNIEKNGKSGGKLTRQRAKNTTTFENSVPLAGLPIKAQQIIHCKSAFVVHLKRFEHFSFSAVL